MSEEDKLIIDKVLGYDDLATRYEPDLSDNVKNKFNKYLLKVNYSVFHTKQSEYIY
mgnify:CR=1 FL=1